MKMTERKTRTLSRHYVASSGLLLCGVLTLAMTGCGEDDCEKTRSCDTGDGGASSRETEGCGPEGDRCAELDWVAVSPDGSDATGDGTADAPLQTVAYGLLVAQQGAQEVHLCSTNGPFSEQLLVSARDDDLRVVGGFDCSTFEPNDDAALIEAPSSEKQHAIERAADVVLENLHLRAADAENAGDSSTALTITDATGAILRNIELTTGRGADGADGDMPDTLGQDGVDGMDGYAICPEGLTTNVDDAYVGVLISDITSGVAELQCGDDETRGGKAGLAPEATNTSTGIGGNGFPYVEDSGYGDGGALASAGSSIKCTPSAGADGDNGGLEPTDKAPGKWANGIYAPPISSAGEEGKPGGGGGGGGASRKEVSTGEASGICAIGPGGGGGGSGGCGGPGGKGGQGGGGSFGLVVVDSELTIDTLTVTVKAAGSGGRGGRGAAGGVGGQGGAKSALGDLSGTTLPACDGAAGGSGGRGGPGQGGRGGPAVGVVLLGSEMTGAPEITLPDPAPGGSVGDNDNSVSGDGSEGDVATVWKLEDKNAETPE